MLTRLKVNGFKNLVNVDVRFGPFTCIAGANGVGKSNLFDAIRFLSALADGQLIEAAKSVREGKTADVRSLFHRVGDHYDDRMTFEAEMIIPPEGADDLGQQAKATITFLRYTLVLGYRKNESRLSLGGLELETEKLVHINIGSAKNHLLFPHSREWRDSAIRGRRTSEFISTETDKESQESVIKLHADQGSTGGGRPSARRAATLPRTVLSVVNAAEHKTALLARREMQSWHLLQLEPSKLREPDEFLATNRLGPDGSHLAATLYRLSRSATGGSEDDDVGEARVFAQVANRLAVLIDVHDVSVDRDEQRELLTLMVKGRDGTSHAARSLSDGTLRFLALAVLELDTTAQGVLCLEEPENGIHPERIPAMLKLLNDVAVDVHLPVGPDNPLRQVIINTHSPVVVSEVDDDSLVIAELEERVEHGRRFETVRFSCLDDTWRSDQGKSPTVSRGKLLVYLNPVIPQAGEDHCLATPRRRTRVADREDLRPHFPTWDKM